MSHTFLFGGIKIGSNTAFHCFVLQRKLVYSIKYVVYEIRRQNVKKFCDRTLSPYWKTIFLLPQRGSKDCIETTFRKKSSFECEGVQIMS